MSMNIFVASLPFTFMTIIWVAMTFAARRTRPEIFFTVTVSPSTPDSEHGRVIIRRFTRTVALASIVGFALSTPGLFCASAAIASIYFGAGIVAQIIGANAAYLRARKAALAWQVEPSRQHEASLLPRRTRPVGGFWGQAGPFLVLLFFILVIALKWRDYPARFPMHWGADGKANAWADKSLATVFLLPGVGLLVCALFAAMALSLERGARRIHATGSEAAGETQFRRGALGMLLGIEYFMAALLGALGFLPIWTASGPHEFPITLLAILSSLLPVAVLSATLILADKHGQGGWRRPGEPKDASSPPVGDRTPDACWKGGLFYYNPNDSALWVEKRFGIGWTLNMANARAWLFLGALLLFGAATIVLPTFLLRH